ncbi:hypothetical protein D3C77_365070 [compost metagenome]
MTVAPQSGTGCHWPTNARYNPVKLEPQSFMKLLNTYDDRDEAEEAAEKLSGDKRLASERDATVVIYNLFGTPSWGNFHRLSMYNLGELKILLERRTNWQAADYARHAEIISTLKTVAKNYEIEVPMHWMQEHTD